MLTSFLDLFLGVRGERAAPAPQGPTMGLTSRDAGEGPSQYNQSGAICVSPRVNWLQSGPAGLGEDRSPGPCKGSFTPFPFLSWPHPNHLLSLLPMAP